MAPRIVPGPASERLAAMISHHLDDEPVPCTVNRFPDGELLPELATVRGKHGFNGTDVFLLGSRSEPVNTTTGSGHAGGTQEFTGGTGRYEGATGYTYLNQHFETDHFVTRIQGEVCRPG